MKSLRSLQSLRIGLQCAVTSVAGLACTGAVALAWAEAAVDAVASSSPAPTAAPTLVADAVGSSSPQPAPARTAAATASGPSFVLQAVRFVGATVYSNEELQQLVVGHIGKPATLTDLEAIAQAVSERYRAAGYLLAHAIVPIQDVSGGQVEISVLEGQLGKVRFEIDPAAPIRESQVRAIAAKLMPGAPLREATLSRVMLLLSDLPGISAQAALESGEVAGSTDLIITVAPTRRWDLALDADNHGSRSTSEYQAGVRGRWNSPLGVGDNLDFRLQLGAHSGLVFGRLGYERPIGDEGQRVGVAISTLEYTLGGEFVILDARGRADIVDASITQPFMRSRSRNLFGKATLQYKRLNDRIGAVSSVEDKWMSNLILALNHENNDTWLGGGYSNAGLSALIGRLVLGSEQQREVDQAIRHTEGSFAHLNYSFSRLNVLTERSHWFVGMGGQFASKNLDSAEKVALGGPRGVRAYAPTEGTADEAHILNAELRFSPIPEVSLQVFYDWGRAKFNRNPTALDTRNSVVLRGYGGGWFWGTQSGFSLRGSLAWRATGPGIADPQQRNPRLYLQVEQSL